MSAKLWHKLTSLHHVPLGLPGLPGLGSTTCQYLLKETKPSLIHAPFCVQQNYSGHRLTANQKSTQVSCIASGRYAAPLTKLKVSQPCAALFRQIHTLDMSDNKYIVGYAKLGTSSCKKCKQKIEKGALRIGKVVPNPFGGDGGDMKQWFHPSCIFETFLRARATTKKIEDPDDVDGFEDLKQEDKDTINQLIDGESLNGIGNNNNGNL